MLNTLPIPYQSQWSFPYGKYIKEPLRKYQTECLLKFMDPAVISSVLTGTVFIC